MDVWVKKIGRGRDGTGTPRIYLDGQQAVRAGFSPGQKFDVRVDGSTLVLSVNNDGSRTVSRKTVRDREYPVVDLHSAELLKLFEGMDAVRVVVKAHAVYFLPLASEVAKKERLERIKGAVLSQRPLKMGSASHGGGVLSKAIHEGLARAGMLADLAFANDIREDLLEQASIANDAWNDQTMALAIPMQEVAQDEWLLKQLPKLDVLEMGLPCSGASRAGKAKRGLSMMEEHPEVGHLVYAGLVIIAKTQPAVLLLENVVDYSTTGSAQILRHQLRDMGYTTHEAVLEGRDWGCLENRVRWCMVAVTKGLEFSFDDIRPVVTVVRTLGEVLDPIAEDDPRWSVMQGLKDKRVRNLEAGNNFRMQVFDAGSTKIGTVTKQYSKVRSTDPKIAHPSNPDLLRQLTPMEHARVKGIPSQLIQGLSATIAHELLGQSIVYDPFVSVGQRIGESLQALRSADDTAGNVEVGVPVVREIERRRVCNSK